MSAALANRPSHTDAATIQLEREVVACGSMTAGSEATTSSPPVTGSEEAPPPWGEPQPDRRSAVPPTSPSAAALR